MPACMLTELECSVLYSLFLRRVGKLNLSAEEEDVISRLAHAAGESPTHLAGDAPPSAVSPVRKAKGRPARQRRAEKEDRATSKVRI